MKILFFGDVFGKPGREALGFIIPQWRAEHAPDVIIANGALLAGHVTVGDRAFISGNCLVHQFVRVGTLALMQGGAAISKDLPPYTIARGDNGICGLNIVGLRRAGFTAEERLELKQLYHLLFRRRARLKTSCTMTFSYAL